MSTTRHIVLGALAWLCVAAAVAPLSAQGVGKLLSPGPLSKAHAKLEGIGSCEKCHEPGKGISAKKCLGCHRPIAKRMASKSGVHRDVGDDCVACHVEHAGRDADIRPLDKRDFDHLEETGFALDGLHEKVAKDCSKCHKTRSYLELTPDCASCHKDVHKGALGIGCVGCHSTTASFRDTGLAFDHNTAAYPLVGAHQTVQCVACHRDREYKGLKFSECSDCHRDPHEALFGAACASCHTTERWSTSTVDHSKTRFPLEGKHTSVTCSKCHGTGHAATTELRFQRCSDCHADPHLGTFSEDCATCHTVDGFRGATFDHRARTEFPLDERHAEVACVACHKKQATPGSEVVPALDYRGLSGVCVACHTDVHKGELGAVCSSCHGTRTFRLTAFQHPKNQEFFRGKHATDDCTKCHRDALEPANAESMVSSRRYRDLSTTCVDCHQDVHLGQLGADCASCHRIEEDRFSAQDFDHSRVAFILTGKHASIECVTCHKQETGLFPSGEGAAVRFKGMEGTCVSCHRDIHLGQLGNRCESCHGTQTFKLTDHTHGEDAEFFTGEHSSVACRDCHRSLEALYPAGRGEALQFSGLDRNCVTCHDDAHQGSLGADCASCHGVWAPFRSASRAFHKDTLLPLEGRHLAVPCADCHWNGQIKGTPTTCFDCHWIRRQDDRFRTALGAECENCHRPTSWTAVTWDHGAITGQQLGGAHFGIDCESCHTSGRFEAGVPTDCVSCHLADYQGTDDPDHVAAGFPTDCELCHSPSTPSWEDPIFDHSAFQLGGAHTSLDCDSCHASGVYQGLPSDCVDCHLSDYQETDDPNHEAAGFPTDCEVCHSPSSPSWEGASFAHTVFPLVGAHTSLDCNSCHASGVYTGLPSDCVDCHLSDYQETDDPNHEAAGFPTDCQVCHSPSSPSWEGASFAHTVFPLVGAHTSLDCNSCHASGVYTGLPSDCVDCHLSDYQETDDPNHETAGFPTDCEVCHSPSSPSWEGASFAHTVFPLVGAHTSLDCNSCHASGVYTGLPSDCVDCHLSDYQETDDPDHETAGFPTDCEVCHSPSSPSWEGATFAHTVFPLVGAHTSLDCNSCHASGVYTGLPSDCVDCHLSDFQETSDPDHQAAGFPIDCEICHRASDVSWDQGIFDHVWFPVDSGDHKNFECSECHTTPGIYAVFSCTTSCHPRSEADEDHNDVDGYVYESSACLSCHPDGESAFGPSPVRSHARTG